MLFLAFCCFLLFFAALFGLSLPPGGSRRDQEGPAGTRGTRRDQEGQGGARRDQERPGEARRDKEGPGEARRGLERPGEEPGGARRSQERPGGTRRDQEGPGETTKKGMKKYILIDLVFSAFCSALFGAFLVPFLVLFDVFLCCFSAVLLLFRSLSQDSGPQVWVRVASEASNQIKTLSLFCLRSFSARLLLLFCSSTALP